MRELRERMSAVVDEEVTAEARDRVAINYGFHEELDRAKETFETLDGEFSLWLCFPPRRLHTGRFGLGFLDMSHRNVGAPRFVSAEKETLSEVGRQVLAKHQDLISLKVVFLPQVSAQSQALNLPR